MKTADETAKRLRENGKATRFKPGNPGGPGRPKKDVSYEQRQTTAALVVERLVEASIPAVATLEDLLQCPQANVRAQAARSILTLSIDQREAAELAQRVAELEERLSSIYMPGQMRAVR